MSDKNLKYENIKKQVDEDISILAKNFSDVIKNKRINKNLSMAELYKLSGVSSSTINDIEKAKYLPHFDIVLKLGYALGLSFKDIVSIFNNTSYDDNLLSNKLCKKEMDLIKCELQGLNFSEEDIDEAIEYIRFKGRKYNPILPESYYN